MFTIIICIILLIIGIGFLILKSKKLVKGNTSFDENALAGTAITNLARSGAIG